LAGYIFGGNSNKDSIAMTTPVSEIDTSHQQIAMTVPVTQTNTVNNTRIIQFSMPSKYTLDSLPLPDDDRVKFRTID